MLRKALRATFVLGVVACNELATIKEGDTRVEIECVSLSDCVVEFPECQKATSCQAGRCIFVPMPQDSPLAQQTQGDCVKKVCDGTGRVKWVPDPSDPGDDGNPCTFDHCEGTVPVHSVEPFYHCFSGPSEARGKGICRDGIQLCDSTGKPFGNCQGEVLPAEETCSTTDDDDCDGETNEEGANCNCLPGETTECYAGPPGTAGTGICKIGLQTCKSNGLGYGPCEGQQLPIAETCDIAHLDEDCDGTSNEEGIDCICGDGFVSPARGETCDDGNSNDTDECRNDCVLATCGDGVIQAGEPCDDGNVSNADACTNGCLGARCGDGYLQQGESCDDGNTTSDDACPALCLRSAVKIAAGNKFTCAILMDGSVKCWGTNFTGQLGVGDTKARGDDPDEMGDNLPPASLGGGNDAVDIVAGESHVCVILLGGTVKCWGSNGHGRLGLGDQLYRGDNPNEMGDNLPAVSLGKPAIDIGAGVTHTCAILSDGQLKCWGSGGAGELGLGDNGTRGDEPLEMGNMLPPVNLGTGKKAVAVTCGHQYTCAILNDGSVKCWGRNDDGQLGLGDNVSRGFLPEHMGDALPVVNLGTGKTAVQIAANYNHTCALLNDGNVKCWGSNSAGQLGLEGYSPIGDEPNEMGDNLPAVDLGPGKTAVAMTSSCALLNDGHVKCWNRSLDTVNLGTGKMAMVIASGSDHDCAIVTGGRIKCWGWNQLGQLGLGHTLRIGDDVDEQGDLLPFVAP